tara:strand:+ start:303 stop:470 length:168 start_codon:yes stop_codon:yes gene_type:complete
LKRYFLLWSIIAVITRIKNTVLIVGAKIHQAEKNHAGANIAKIKKRKSMKGINHI